MGSFENLFATPLSGTLKFQNGGYINNSLTAGLQATFGFSGVVNGRTLLLDPRYLRTAEAVYVSTTDPRDMFMVSWNVDNRTSSMGTPVRFASTNANVTMLDDSDDAGVYKLTSLKLQDYWVGKSSNVKFQNYSVANSPFSLTLLKAPDYTYDLQAPTSVAEGSGALITITRNGATGFSSVVYLNTVAGSATAGSDFIVFNKVAVSFGENESTRTINVRALMDTVAESPETFSAQIFSKQTDATPIQSRNITINNTVPSFSYTVSALTVADEGGAVTFKIDRTGTTDLASTVFANTASGSAVEGADFNAVLRVPVQFSVGMLSTTIQVQTRVDAFDEQQENFLLRLFDSTTSVTALASGTGLINNRDSINLTGTAANNNIVGNELDNIITGLGGGDQLTGGLGRDTFRYLNVTDSGLLASAQDRITDFRKGEDKIDLSAIDANQGLAGDQAFTGFISPTAAFTTPGQMKINHNGSYNYTIFLNTNTTAAAEAAINVQLVGVPSGQPQSLALSDFTL